MKDIEILRELARELSVYALDGRSNARKQRYRDLNSLKCVRPPVLVFEEPWGEYRSCPELRCICQDEKFKALEEHMRRELFKFRHYEADYAIHDYFRSHVALSSTGDGLTQSENTASVKTGTHIMGHIYHDTIPTPEAFLEMVKTPVITHDKAETERRLSFADEIWHGIMPVKKAGVGLYLASWDQIPRFHGVENCLMDLYDDPDYAHLLISKFTDNHIAVMKQYEALNVLDTDPLYLHCTPAATHELPVLDMDKDDIRLEHIWARAMAQIFACVSPEMHDEFDLQYTQKMFDLCGLSYYGCCEPLDTKIEKLRRFKNLRRISITAWADVDSAAEKIGKDFILSYKPNPAFVASPVFDPEPVKAEIKKVLEACKRNQTPCEFILKDISTTANNYANLTQWVDTVNSVIDGYFPR